MIWGEKGGKKVPEIEQARLSSVVQVMERKGEQVEVTELPRGTCPLLGSLTLFRF